MSKITHSIKAFILRSILLLSPLGGVWGVTSCVDVEEQSNDVQGNVEALWQIMDQHYCFFKEKQEQLGVDWNDVHNRYLRNANSSMSRYQLFEFLGNMLGELRDGHVNMAASFDYARNWSWKEDYPTNFSDTLERKYLGTDYKIATGMYYRILDDNIGYIYLSSFADALGEGNLDEIFYYLAPCDGLILDIRCNGGGMLTEAQKLAARFCNQKTLVGYIRHKTGTGHEDFSDYESQYIEPSSNIRWQKPVCLLTNRSVFSAANEFTKYMKALFKANASTGSTSPLARPKDALPSVQRTGGLGMGAQKTSPLTGGLGGILGDRTGGGAGMPYSAELPNGWSVRLSACPMYDTDKVCTEDGIAPDVTVSLQDSDVIKGKDTIIEAARQLLHSK